MLLLTQILMVLALACFLVEAIQKRSIVALGLACWVLAQLLAHF